MAQRMKKPTIISAASRNQLTPRQTQRELTELLLEAEEVRIFNTRKLSKGAKSETRSGN